jgi:hypothetical protein
VKEGTWMVAPEKYVLEKVKQTLRENKRIVRTTKGLRKERARKAMIPL